MSKLRRANKIDQMSTAEWQQYHHLLTNKRLMTYFADEVNRFSRSPMKPDDVLRRFSLNGDGHLDLREFQLAVTRLEIVLTSSPQNGSQEDSQQERDLARAKELYLVFCPTQTRKLDIDLFCRIMTEWSLQLMRASYQPKQAAQLTSAMSNLSMGNRIQYAAPRSHLPTPYATQTSLEVSRAASGESKNQGNDGDLDGSGRSTRLMDGEVLWQRLTAAITQNSEKLRQIFLKMDVMSSGKVSPEELELALSHIGVFLTTREYEKLYMSIGEDVKEYSRDGDINGRWRGRGGNGNAFVINYAAFIALFQETAGRDQRTQALPSNSKQASPPVVGLGTARLWDFLVAGLDKLQPLFQQYQRIGQNFLAPETFRECLLRCGITMSNADFAALRVRLLPFTDSPSGAIGIASLVDALKSADRTTMKSKASPSVSGAPGGQVGVSPIRLGRKTITTTSLNVMNTDLSPYPAGKSTEERNAEANRTIVKIRDERRRESDKQFPLMTRSPRAAANDEGESEAYLEHQHRRHDPFFSNGKPLPELEARVLSKLQQLKQLGQLSSCSPQSIFPADRFGHISRGQFRQGLVDLGLLARYAEVEALFWTLDPQGHGFVKAQDFYDHLNCFSTHSSNCASSKPGLSIDPSAQAGRLPRSVQKVLEKMYLELPRLRSICERMDDRRTGTVSLTEMLSAIHEMGFMASVADKQAAIDALSRGQYSQNTGSSSGRISYLSLEERLAGICSDLLSPKKRKKHLTTTSVLLTPYEDHGLAPDSSASHNQGGRSNDALWNCPRRRMHQDHPAARSSIRITDSVGSPSNELTPVRPPQRPAAIQEAVSRQERRHRIALVSILQDLLERRSDLKTALDLHRRADARGLVTKHDLAEILLTSRLNLHFPAGSPAAQELVNELYPTLGPDSSLGFLDVLRRISELLAEVTKELSMPPPSSGTGPASTFSTNPYQQPRQTGRRHNGTNLDMHSSVLPMKTLSPSSLKKHLAVSHGSPRAGNASTIRRKLLQESRLKDHLDSDYGLQSAAVLVRHAFKGLAPREMVVPVDNGEFEATCRASDVKHVCYRLGLDLDMYEQQLVVDSVDDEDTGFVSSPDLLDFFIRLAQPDEFSSSVPKAKDKINDVDVRRSVTFHDPVNSDEQYYQHMRGCRPNPIVH